MYNSQPPSQHGYPGQQPPLAGYPQNAPQSDHEMRYSHGAPQQSYPSGPPNYAPPPQYAPSRVPGHGSSHGGGISPPPVQAGPVPTGYPMDTYTISQFVNNTQPGPGIGTCPFEVDKSRPAMLQVNFGCQSTIGGSLQQIYMKKGSMVAYRGEIKFEREGMMEHGMAHMLKKAVTSEGASLIKATAPKGSRSQLYVADMNKMITVLQLQGESITVNGDDLLAFEQSLQHKIVMMKKLSSIVSGGLFNVKLSGRGCVAILSHGKPLTLVVRQGEPIVYTDPEATVAWSGNLNPDFNTDLQFKTLLGRGSGESFQMKFDPRKGEGFVVVQPYEEVAASGGTSLTSAVFG